MRRPIGTSSVRREEPGNNLRRELAPISDAAWAAIDEDAARVLKLKLANRRLVDCDGPRGPDHAAVELSRAALDGIERGRKDPDLALEPRCYTG